MKNPAILLVLIIWVRVDAAPAEYTYSCWLNGWRKNTNDRSADVFGIETSHYGFALDIADFRNAGFGQLNNPAGYEQALEHKADKLRQLPPAELLIELEVDGVRYWAHGYRALIVRQYKVVAGGRAYTNPTLSVPVYKADPTNFEGLESNKEYRLYQVIDGKRTRFDQSVHGNDFWQTDYDAAKASYAMTFNLPLDGLGESEWIFVRQIGRDLR